MHFIYTVVSFTFFFFLVCLKIAFCGLVGLIFKWNTKSLVSIYWIHMNTIIKSFFKVFFWKIVNRTKYKLEKVTLLQFRKK